MGHSISYHRHNPTCPQYLDHRTFSPGFTTADVHKRAPAFPDYGAGSEAIAAEAISRAREAARLAAAAEDAVTSQAVYALSKQGASVRRIADQLDMKKSTVGRILRKTSDNTLVIGLSPAGMSPSDPYQVHARVHDAWYPPYVHVPELNTSINVVNCLRTTAQYNPQESGPRQTMVSVVRCILIERGEYQEHHDGLVTEPFKTSHTPTDESDNDSPAVPTALNSYRGVFGPPDCSIREDRIHEALGTAESWKDRVYDDAELINELDFAISTLQWGLNNPRQAGY